MELVFVRHGEPHSEHRTDGAADPALTDLGRSQAEALARWLPAGPIDAIYCSPMLRARQTAEPLVAATRIEATYRDGLREWGSGSRRYIGERDFAAAKASGVVDPALERLASGLADEKGFAFRRTVVTAVEEIVADHAGQTVTVVCHGGVINAYVSHILGIERVLFFNPAHTSITRVRANRDGRRALHTANETPHLAPGQPSG